MVDIISLKTNIIQTVITLTHIVVCSLTLYTFKGIDLNKSPYSAMTMYLVGVYLNTICNIFYLYHKWKKYFIIKRQIYNAVRNRVYIENIEIDYTITESPISFKIRGFGLTMSFISSTLVVNKVFPDRCGDYKDHISCIPLIIYSWLFSLIYILLGFIIIALILRLICTLCNSSNHLSITDQEIERIRDVLHNYAIGQMNPNVASIRNIEYKLSKVTVSDDEICPICLESNTESKTQRNESNESNQSNENNQTATNNWVKLRDCKHLFHKKCIKDWIKAETQNNKITKCPVCRIDIRYRFIRQEIV
jgi:hypothetical protein